MNRYYTFAITSQLTIVNNGIVQNDAEITQRISGQYFADALRNSDIMNELKFKVKMCYELAYDEKDAIEMANVFVTSVLTNSLQSGKPTSLKVEHENNIRSIEIKCEVV